MLFHLTLRAKWVIVTITIVAFSMAIGASCAHGSFTIQDEEKLGREFYEQLKSKDILIHNPQVSDYIDKIGRQVLEHADDSPFSFTFSVIDNSGINAFATPGGYIYVYDGLIKLAENESQLAGVIAHEIAHATSRHIAEAIEKSKKVNMAALLGILAGAFLGGGGEGAAAITSFSMAAATTLNLKYTRDNEEEADRKGMRYLTASGYDGKAMLDFLKIMRRFEYFSNSIPSYFLTHPGTSDRIRYLDGLLQMTYTQGGKSTLIGGLNRIKTILVLEQDNLSESLKFFHNALSEHPDNPDFTYGLAVVQGKLGQTDEALKNFLKALSQSPDDGRILRDLGIFYFNQGKAPDALEPLKKAYYFNQNDATTILYLGRTYEATGSNFEALELYEKFQRDNPDDTAIYYSLAMIYGKTANPGESHYNFGIYFKKMNKDKSALFHFKAAQDYFPPYSDKGRFIQNEIDELESPPSPHRKPPPSPLS
ncbi:MAG: M48 family metalloprotease [Deltaproteobacteria bacterium]|nr:M48 family metalloprotease [Deltaproteobacteria bacterium]MBN2687552.1 M48 family metalloprotease [Deltaproteobacteria bacterium]